MLGPTASVSTLLTGLVLKGVADAVVAAKRLHDPTNSAATSLDTLREVLMLPSLRI
jgi:hypothetical protein